MKKEKPVKANKPEASIQARVRAYIDLDKKLMAQLASMSPADSAKHKWDVFDRLNRAYEKLSKEDRLWMHGKGKVYVNTSTTMNEAASQARNYKREVDKGVTVADLIQPLNTDGSPNQDFVERYGIANYTPEQKEHIREKMGRDPHREKDWRSEKK